jgi:hypothetical protein
MKARHLQARASMDFCAIAGKRGEKLGRRDDSAYLANVFRRKEW